MTDLLVCRVCLATNVKLYNMYENRLVWPYEFLTGLKVQKQGLYSHRACGVCSSQLLKWMSFRDLCHSSQNLIKFAYNQKHKITVDYIKSLNLNLNTLSSLSIDRDVANLSCDGSSDVVKKETSVDKLEIENTLSDEGFLPDQNHLDENVANEEVIQGEDNDDYPNTDYVDENGSREILEEEIDLLILTKEQQREELQARKTSRNYLNSFYKCEKCFKGFMTEVTFQNHMERHDPSNGPVECEICQTFWPTLSTMKSHVATAHEQKYICRLCSLVSRSKHRAKEHWQWHRGHTFVCKICGAEFEKSTSHLTHLRLQHPSEHICDICGESFVSANGLKMHKTKTHKNIERKGQYLCGVCSTEFQCEEALMKHFEDSDTTCINIIPCVHCGESFVDECQLKEHLKSHTKDVPTKCEECDKSFIGERQYVLHYQRVHLREKKKHKNPPGCKSVTMCEICGKRCFTMSGLLYHQRIHTGEKPYACSRCPKKFSVQQRLQIHFRTHTGESPFKCSHCPKAFKHKAALNRHDRVHTGLKPYSCSHCGKCFSQSNSMKVHVKTVHLKLPAPYRNRHQEKGSTLNSNLV